MLSSAVSALAVRSVSTNGNNCSGHERPLRGADMTTDEESRTIKAILIDLHAKKGCSDIGIRVTADKGCICKASRDGQTWMTNGDDPLETVQELWEKIPWPLQT